MSPFFPIRSRERSYPRKRGKKTTGGLVFIGQGVRRLTSAFGFLFFAPLFNVLRFYGIALLGCALALYLNKSRIGENAGEKYDTSFITV